MKKQMAQVLALSCVLVLIGCAGKTNETATDFVETETTPIDEVYPEPISPDMLAQGVYDELQKEWTSYDALSTEQKMLSSHTPGACQKDFEDWAECEEFLGLSIPNPLESGSWPEKGTYVGMPIGFQDAPCVQATWYGTRDGKVEWISVQSGYYDGQIRITVDAKLYGDTADIDISSGITEDSGEQYVSNTAYLVQGHVLYTISVIGEPDMQNEVQETMEQILPAFEKE